MMANTIKPIESRRDIIAHAEEIIGLCDRLINKQLNQIIHHHAFQRLEAAWRGLQLVTNSVTKTQRTKILIRILPINLQEWLRDLNNVTDFEQSVLFKKIYTEELDQSGGEPFGLLIGDYFLSHQVGIGGEQLGALQQMAKISAMAFAPFITAVDARFFGIEHFADLQTTFNLSRLLLASEYHRWHKLRQDDTTHFVGLVLPRVLLRQPYGKDYTAKKRYFIETAIEHQEYCWGNACYVYASNVVRTFAETGWFINRHGAALGSSQELVTLARAKFSAGCNRYLTKITTECLMTDNQENHLADNGFITLCDQPHSNQTIFHSNPSIKLAQFNSKNVDPATVKINTLLHYVLCSSRFAQYIKVIIRDKLGTFLSKEDCETYLSKWLNQYCSAAEGQSITTLAKNPLTHADVTVNEKSGEPGNFYCSIIISPHSQYDEIRSQLKLVTNVKLT